MAAANDSLWRRFARAIGREELAEDSRWAKNAARVAGRGEREAEIEKTMRTKTRAEWAEIISAAGVPCGPVRTIAELCADPQIRHREMVVEMPHAKTGVLKVMGNPVKLSGTPGEIRLPPPLLGEHTEEILTGLLGRTGAEVGALRERGVV